MSEPYSLEKELEFLRRILNKEKDWTASEEDIMVALSKVARAEITASTSDKITAMEMLSDYHDRNQRG